MINFTTIIYFCQYLLVTKNNYFIFIISSIYDRIWLESWTSDETELWKNFRSIYSK